MKNKILITTALLALTGCNNLMVDKIKNIGQLPQMKEVAQHFDESSEAAKAPVSWPISRVKHNTVMTSNSLWKNSKYNMFVDDRARNVGDILTVNVKLKEKAELDNKTERKRSSQDALGASKIFGLEKLLTAFLPGKADPAQLLSVNGSMDSKGEGIIEREEVIEFDVAAVVKQVMPNGNVVIYGSQEMRVNNEIRQITIEGVVRPKDIDPNNVVDLKRIAEARVSYGGKGLITDVQQPRIGNQIIDVLAPW